MRPTWTLDEQIVNTPTFFASLLVRVVFAVVGVAVIAATTPFTFVQVGGVLAGIMLIRSNAVLRFSDR